MRTVPPDLQSDNRRDYPPDLRVVVACAVVRPDDRRIRVRDSSSFGNCQKKGSSPRLFRPTPPKGLNPGGPTSFCLADSSGFFREGYFGSLSPILSKYDGYSFDTRGTVIPRASFRRLPLGPTHRGVSSLVA